MKDLLLKIEAAKAELAWLEKLATNPAAEKENLPAIDASARHLIGLLQAVKDDTYRLRLVK